MLQKILVQISILTFLALCINADDEAWDNNLSNTSETLMESENGVQQGNSSTEFGNDYFVTTASTKEFESSTNEHTQENNYSQTTASFTENLTFTLVVLGKSGSGISSTILKLFGKPRIPKPEIGSRYFVVEYRVPMKRGVFLRILDVEGIVDGKSLAIDSLILATLHEYLQDPINGISESRTMFLIVSNFDDNRFVGPHTTYTKVLSRVKFLQNLVFPTIPSQITNIFLLTRHQSETRLVQKRSKSKINEFASAIKNYTEFVSPYHILVGENCQDSDLVVDENGFVKLLNKDLYPKNVFDTIVEIITSKDSELADQIKNYSVTRQTSEDPSMTPVPNCTNRETINSYVDLINLSQFTVEPTEVNILLRKAFDEMEDPVVKDEVRNVITLLQAHLQNVNIRQLSQLPKTTLEKVNFFQNLPQGLTRKAFTFLNNIMEGYIPEYIQPLFVGSSFDILTDEVSNMPLFNSESLDSSPSGYLLPSYITCKKFQDPIIKNYAIIAKDYEDYVKVRLTKLYFKDKRNLNISCFNWNKRLGYNYETENETLGTVQEIRTFEFILNEQVEFTQNFINEIEALESVNLTNKAQVQSWQSFFNMYGTHVVTSGYVGGRIQGLLNNPNVSQLSTVEKKLELESMVAMDNLHKIPIKPSYTFYGGELYQNLSKWDSLNSQEQEILLEKWKKSNFLDPIPLDYELHLVPLYDYVNIYYQSTSIANHIKDATELYLNNKLIHRRVRKGNGNKKKTEQSNKKVIPTPVTIESTTEALQSALQPTVPSNEEMTTIKLVTTVPTSTKRSPIVATATRKYGHRNRTSIRRITTTIKPATIKPATIKPETINPAILALSAVYLPFNPLVMIDYVTNSLTESIDSSSQLLNLMKETTNQLRNQKLQNEKVFYEIAKHNARKDNQTNTEIQLSINKRRKVVEDSKRIYEQKHKDFVDQITKLEEEKLRYLQEIEMEGNEERRRLKNQFDQNIARMEREMKYMEKMLEEIEKQYEESQEGGCLRAGSKILMKDGKQKNVEYLKPGDYILNFELSPVKVLGVLKKYLGDDEFYGFSPNGPFFFTKTHLMVGPIQELFVTDINALIQENPLMETLNVREFKASGNLMYHYEQRTNSMESKLFQIYKDPEFSKSDTWVYIILVESDDGTYIVNDFVSRHEIPPLHLWKNTITSVFGMFASPEIQKLLNISYNQNNLNFLTQKIVNLKLVLGVHLNKTDLRTSVKTQPNPANKVDIIEILGKMYENPILSHIITQLYKHCGKLIANQLDNPILNLDQDQIENMSRNIQSIVNQNLII